MVDGKQGSIAIDDIMVSSSENGTCPAERECTFQGSLCGLLPQPSANFTWSRITGASQPANSSGPATDHTLGTEQGQQVFEMQPQLARLFLPIDISRVGLWCLLRLCVRPNKESGEEGDWVDYKMGSICPSVKVTTSLNLAWMLKPAKHILH